MNFDSGTDPEPAFDFDADTDSAFHSDADPDPQHRLKNTSFCNAFKLIKAKIGNFVQKESSFSFPILFCNFSAVLWIWPIRFQGFDDQKFKKKKS
jgi:hypothetical protein